MSSSYAEPNGAGASSSLSLLSRLGRLRSGEAGARASRAADAAAAKPPPLSEAARAVLLQAVGLEEQHNWFRAAPAQGRIGCGVQFAAGELLAWAVDRADPLRPLAVAVIIDGSVVAEAFTAPAEGVLLLPSGWHLRDHATLELAIDGERVAGPGYTDHRFFLTASARAETGEFIDRLKRGWRAQKARRVVRCDIDGTLDRLARPEPAEEGQTAAFLRHFAKVTNTPIRLSGPLALANWIIADVMEDPLRREVFCLDPATAATLNEPAFNTRLLCADVSLALFCFWRRHYQNVDLFSDDGLRRIQFRFATAPFVQIKNNHQLISESIRARLAAPTPGRAELPWSWVLDLPAPGPEQCEPAGRPRPSAGAVVSRGGAGRARPLAAVVQPGVPGRPGGAAGRAATTPASAGSTWR